MLRLLYTLSIEKEADDSEKVIDHNGVKVFIDKKSYIFLAGTELDFSDGLNGRASCSRTPTPRNLVDVVIHSQSRHGNCTQHDDDATLLK